MTSAELLELYARMQAVMIDLNGKGSIVGCQVSTFGGLHSFEITMPISGHLPVPALEVHKVAIAARQHAAKLLAAADNMDRIVQEAMSNEQSRNKNSGPQGFDPLS